MKKLSFILAAVLLVLGLAQCKKEKAQGVANGEKQHVVLSAGNGNDGSKVDVNFSGAFLNLKWQDTDQITVSGGAEGTLYLTSGAGETWATFEGDIEKKNDEDLVFTVGTVNYRKQDGTLAWVKNNIRLEGISEYKPQGDYDVQLKLPYAILKLDLRDMASEDSVYVSVADATIASVGSVSSTSEEMYVALPADGTEKTYTFEGNGVTKSFTWTLGNDTYYTAIDPNTGQPGGGSIPAAANYLCFTAKQAGSTVYAGNINENALQYSTDGAKFKDYKADSTINLTNVGDKVYFKAKSTNSAVGANANSKVFSTTGDLKVSGNIMYLLNGTTPATEMTNANGNCFKKLFQNCTAISDASELQLPATTLAESCYSYMFNGCTSLTAAPELNSTSLANSCYSNMFNGCESLTAAPALNSTSLANSCYSYMFKGCISLTNAPALPATTLTVSCYSNMFFGCSSLVTAPELKATTLANECCQAMFKNCTNLTTAPELKATTLANYCYKGMFKGCSKLSSVTMLATNVNFTDCLLGWLADDAGMSAEKRTVFVAPGMVDAVKAKTPTTWNLIDFCFTAKQANSTVSMAKVETGGTAPTVTLEYSINGTAWNTFTVGTTVTLEKEGDKVYFRAGDGGNKKLATLVNPNPIVITYNYFVTTGDLSVGGNIMYLLDGTTPATTLDTDNTCCFSYLFFNCTAISDFSQLQLPATELADYCYYYMFQKCTGLETAPALPATALADYCYHSMFRGCTGLKTAPALQATELADRCYCNMFYDCTGLKTAPALPATELADRCYYSMFQGCTELSSAPALPATTLASFCYRSMFQGCTKLTTAPELKATALQESCYLSMFQNCTNLTTAPELKATTLAKQCYQGMFYGCTKLSSVTMLATSVSATSCLQKWLENAGSDASVTSAKLYVDRNMMTNTTITNSLPSQKWSVAAGN